MYDKTKKGVRLLLYRGRNQQGNNTPPRSRIALQGVADFSQLLFKNLSVHSRLQVSRLLLQMTLKTDLNASVQRGKATPVTDENTTVTPRKI